MSSEQKMPLEGAEISREDSDWKVVRSEEKILH